jgi:predicted nuclease of restriction endonuclease-like (RecB) superfamily
VSDLVPTPEFELSYARVRAVLEEARRHVHRAINSIMVQAYWEIGRTIVEEEQRGQTRAEYGKQLIMDLSKRLTADFGKGFDRSNLFHMKAYYVAFPKVDALRRELSWTHYRTLLKVEKADARSFYEQEAVTANWSTRELDRQVYSLLFERLALSKDKQGVLELAQKGHEIARPLDLVKDPYVLDFVGLTPSDQYLESDLEAAQIDKLQEFLFYNRLTKCFVLIDLKVGALTHQDLGQMQMYVNYYQREETAPEENPPIGIILCTDKAEAVVRYTLPEGNTQIFASRYKLVLPTEEELAAELRRERADIELHRRLGEGGES